MTQVTQLEVADIVPTQRQRGSLSRLKTKIRFRFIELWVTIRIRRSENVLQMSLKHKLL